MRRRLRDHHPAGEWSAELSTPLEHVLDLRRVGSGVVVRGVSELLVGDRQLQPVAEDLELVLGQFLGLVGDVPRLDPGSEGPALDRLGQDHHRCAAVLHRGRVGAVHLAVVVPAASQLRQLIVREMLDEAAQPGVGSEEVLADIGAIGHRQALVVAVQRLVHLGEQDAILVAREQVIPLACPDDLDHVPSGTAEDRLQLLDDLAVAAHRAVQALQVAVDDEGQVVQSLARGNREGAESLRLIHLAVAQEGPDAAPACVGDAACGEVPIEACLVDGVHRPQAHAHGRELPELGHQPGVRIRRQAGPDNFLPEMVEILFGQASLEKGTGINTRR
jgi:hypothetical protein